MTNDLAAERTRASQWFRSLRDEIVATFEGWKTVTTKVPLPKNPQDDLKLQKPAAPPMTKTTLGAGLCL